MRLSSKDAVCYASRFLLNTLFAIFVLMTNVSPATAKDDNRFPELVGDWKNAPPPFTSIVEKLYSHESIPNKYESWDVTARNSIYIKPRDDEGDTLYFSFRQIDKHYYVGTYSDIEKSDGESRYSFYGLRQIGSDLASSVKFLKQRGIIFHEYTTVKSDYPIVKGSQITFSDDRHGKRAGSTYVSLGLVRDYPQSIASYAPIIAFGDLNGTVLGYWSQTIRWPVMWLNYDGTVRSIVVGVTVGGREFGETYEQASKDIASTPIATAARDHKAVQSAAMLNQVVAGLATLGTQVAVGNAAIRYGHAAPSLIVPNVNSSDGGASAMAMNQQIIAATLSQPALHPSGSSSVRQNKTASSIALASIKTSPGIKPANETEAPVASSNNSYRNHPELDAGSCLTFQGPIDLYGERVTNRCAYTVAYIFCIDGAHSALACKVSGNDIGSGSDTISPGQTQDTGFVDSRGGKVQNYWHACKGKLGDVTPLMLTRKLGTCMSY